MLDRVFRQDMHFLDIRSMALTCKKWRAAATAKVPFTMDIFAENRHKREMRSNAEREKQRQKAIQRRKDLSYAMGNFAVMSIFTVAALAIGLTALLYFRYLFQSVSIVPDCDSAYSLRVSLYCCCAFWLLDSFLFFLWSLASFSPWPYNYPPGSIWFKLTLEKMFLYCNGVGILSNLGIWSSAAACIHFCNSCMDLNPFVAWQARVFAAFSVAVGVFINLLGMKFEQMTR